MNPGRNKQPRPKLAITVAALGVVAIFVGLAAHHNGGSRGRFDPHSLTAQAQPEWLISLNSDHALRGPWRDQPPYELVAYLIEQGYWTPTDHEPRWVPMYRTNRRWRGGVSPAYHGLNAHMHQWTQLTEAHPDLAAVVWPELLDALRYHPEPRAQAQLILESADAAIGEDHPVNAYRTRVDEARQRSSTP
ncbi:MAG: hypothetical protein AAF823_15480 [Planctomycetota bacterium]